jgi:ATP-dependent DNA helicase RecG
VGASSPAADREIAVTRLRDAISYLVTTALPTAFASARPLDAEELWRAPVRIPRPSVLAAPLQVDGQKPAAGAATLGLHTVGDLLNHLPRDRRDARAIAQLVPGEVATVAVEVRSIGSRPVRRRGMRPLVEATVADSSGAMSATFFNQPWLAQRYVPGTRLMLHGKYEARNRFRVQGHAVTADQGVGADGEDVAHYPATDGLSSTQILALVRAHADALADVGEPLPAWLRAVERLPDRAAALAAMHFGGEQGEEGEGGARRRLAFEELLLVQLALLRRRRLRRTGARAPVLGVAPTLSARWVTEMLPFAPTGDQRRAMAEIDADLATAHPMQRLLMGEVGSGKTVVALYTLLRAVEHGLQGALMAPTEPLAEQHFATIQALMPGEAVPIGLLTGSTPARRRADLLGKLASGELSLIVGTHALIEDPVRFAALGVAVVDEQHRFGVNQRAALDAKAGGGVGAAPGQVGDRDPQASQSDLEVVRPHVLHMTATPIPRTLALSHYGDLDVTVLAELPRGRQPIATHVCSTDGARARAYERMREELRAGRQAFVVCPLITESEAMSARAATAEYERLSAGELRDFRVLLMHGQQRSAEKLGVMARFAAGEADVLVATTVIEVGIDVPNATVMLIEDAERYGISQLHQLRGRIGRGEHASLCLLFGPAGSSRLKALAQHGDGFRLAEIDLELRGEGELIGVRQSGLAQFRVAELPRDRELQERARMRAEAIDAGDPELETPVHALLHEALAELYGDEAAAPIRA